MERVESSGPCHKNAKAETLTQKINLCSMLWNLKLPAFLEYLAYLYETLIMFLLKLFACNSNIPFETIVEGFLTKLH